MNDTAPQLPLSTESPAEPQSRWTLQRIVMVASAVIIGVLLLIFVIGVLLALLTDAEQTAPKIQIVRDIFIIILTLQGILIVVALAVLILQIARIINLLQNEIMPVLKNAQDTIGSAKGTVEFVGKNVAEPVIYLSGFVAGTSVFFRELFGLRRALRSDKPDEKHITSE